MGQTRFVRLTVAIGISAATALAQEPSAKANYVAHEWGTFTSMVGQNGIVLEGLQREEEALPGFVHDLLRIEESAMATDTKLPASRVTQKMETPVLYFHADAPLRVRVDVSYRGGLMTQFFPLPSTITPPLAAARAQRIDMSKIDWSWLTWDVDVIPRSAGAPPEIPIVAADHPWTWARQVDSAYVRTRPENAATRVEAEHYIFYRGLGRTQPNVEVRAETGGVVEVQHGLDGEIPFLAVLEMGERGGRFVTANRFAAGSVKEFALGAVAIDANHDAVSRRLGAAVQQALEATGLHQDEARAMVATWSRSWFRTNGTRVIYVLPRVTVDEMLPLWLSPPPRELVRTLVGRIECITPEEQQRVEAAIRANDEAILRGLDRFLEPHLRNVVANGSDPAVRDGAAKRLASLASAGR